MTHPLPVIAIVTPYLAEANNGNWRTAHRWRKLLTRHYKIIVQNAWPLQPERDVDALIVLHALRSATSAAKFRTQNPGKPLIVTLTGTDLYRDLKNSQDAIDTIGAADALIVLPIDLAFVSPEAVSAAVEPLLRQDAGPTVVLVADRHGTGTNALALRPPGVIEFAFGLDSRRVHRAAAEAVGATYVEVDGPLAFDIDTPADLVAVDGRTAETTGVD